VKNLLIGLLLGAAAVAAIFKFMDRDHSPDSDSQSAAAIDARATPMQEEPSHTIDATPESPVRADPQAATGRHQESSVAEQPRPGSVAQELKIPGGALDQTPAAPEPMKQLIEAFRIDCQYGPGHGGNWSEGTLNSHSAAWQGGPVTFDTIDLDAGTALLRNSSGLTRTVDGELGVRVHPTDTGLHFTVFAPGGELIVVSVYGALDTQRRNMSVASFHGPYLNHESAQFYGACTLAG
jgi:hypothetical protein